MDDVHGAKSYDHQDESGQRHAHRHLGLQPLAHVGQLRLGSGIKKARRGLVEGNEPGHALHRAPAKLQKATPQARQPQPLQEAA